MNQILVSVALSRLIYISESLSHISNDPIDSE